MLILLCATLYPAVRLQPSCAGATASIRHPFNRISLFTKHNSVFTCHVYFNCDNHRFSFYHQHLFINLASIQARHPL